jgi:hypothetical protein
MMAYVRRIGDDGGELLRRWVKNEVPDFHMPQVGVGQSRLASLCNDVRVYVPTKEREFKPMQPGIAPRRPKKHAFTKRRIKELFRVVS